MRATLALLSRRHRLIIGLYFILGAWDICLAQFSQWKSFSTADGLGDVEVYTIFETAFGATEKDYLWFGTRHGATRFDGLWRNFTELDNLADNRVLAIAEMDSGVLWFGTAKGISIYKNDKFSDGPDTLASETIWAIAKDNQPGVLWFGTSNGAWRFDRNNLAMPWRQYLFGNSILTHEIRDIWVDSSGNVWFGTPQGVWRPDSSGEVKPEKLAATVMDIFEDRQGKLWFATDGLGIWRYNNSGDYERIGEGKLSARVSAIEQDWDGNYWFTTLDRGVVRYDGQALWEPFRPSNGLAGDVVVDVMEDSYRNVWFATKQTGISRYNGSWRTFKNVSINNDVTLPINQVNTIEKDQNSHFWFGLNGEGVLHYDGDKWQRFNGNEFNSCADNKILSIERDRDRTLWFGTGGRGGGASYFEETQWKIIKSPRARPEECDSLIYYAYKAPADTLADNRVNAIYEDQARNLWFATTWGGVSRYNRLNPQLPKWTTFTKASGLAANTVRAIYEYPRGVLWFATSKGISQFDGSTWTTFDRTNEIRIRAARRNE